MSCSSAPSSVEDRQKKDCKVKENSTSSSLKDSLFRSLAYLPSLLQPQDGVGRREAKLTARVVVVRGAREMWLSAPVSTHTEGQACPLRGGGTAWSLRLRGRRGPGHLLTVILASDAALL